MVSTTVLITVHVLSSVDVPSTVTDVQ